MARTNMGRITSAIALVLVSVFGMAANCLAGEPQYGYTKSEEQEFVINLVDKPNDDGTVLFSYYPDVRVELLADIDNDWAHVRVCNIDGYMKADQVDFDPDLLKASHTLPVFVIKGLKTDSGDVNFRELPTTEVPPLTYHFVGEEGHVMGVSEEWYQVNFLGRMGFMKSAYLKDTGKISEYVIGPVQSPMRGSE